MAVGLVTTVALAGLAGWLGFRTYQSHQTQHQRALFVADARQGAVNLTTIDYNEADADVQLQGRRLAAQVALIKALGGGYVADAPEAAASPRASR